MPSKSSKILIYSHDSFGLGHLRRCRAIAHSAVGHNDDLSALILSGSPIIGSFDFRTQVDFIRIPGVIKLRNGEYTSLNLSIDIEKTLEIRSSIIEHTAKIFEPDIFLVDKEPLGLRAEVRSTLNMLKSKGTRVILGLRDVMDDPDDLDIEWRRKGVLPALEDLYDEIWIYGLPEVYNPFTGLDVPESVLRKTRFTGYLRRHLPESQNDVEPLPFGTDPFILVTPGGGGDGVELIDWVLRAYEAHEEPLFPALIVLGPFMDVEHQHEFTSRVGKLRNVKLIRFTPHIERLMSHSMAIVGMGGYNIFCEILSFDKPTLLVPRVVPRLEQSIRAGRAEEAGLLKVLPIENYPDVDMMTEALSALPKQPPPSAAGHTGLLGGLDFINARIDELLTERGKLFSSPLAEAGE